MKKFAILYGTYKGKAWTDQGYSRILEITDCIMSIIALKAHHSPLKRVEPATNLINEKDLEATRRALLAAPRAHYDGLPLGDVNRDVVFSEGKDGKLTATGRGPEPPDEPIDTGLQHTDFKKGDRVLAYWWGLWWFATVHYVRKTDKSLKLKFDFEKHVVDHYKPRVVRHLL